MLGPKGRRVSLAPSLTLDRLMLTYVLESFIYVLKLNSLTQAIQKLLPKQTDTNMTEIITCPHPCGDKNLHIRIWTELTLNCL